MKQLYARFCASAAGLRQPRTLAMTAMLVALNVTLDLLNIRIQITPEQRTGVGSLTSAMIGMLFGPVPAMTAGAASDILGGLVNTGGGSYYPGCTATAILAGLVWGVWLYGAKPNFWRCLGARATVSVVLNIGLNNVWKYLYFGKGYTFVAVVTSIVKNLVLLLPETILLLACARLVWEIDARLRRQRA